MPLKGSNITSKGITEYPDLILALADPVKGDKIRRITDSLKNANQLDNVRYGVYGPTFKRINELYINKKLATIA